MQIRENAVAYRGESDCTKGEQRWIVKELQCGRDTNDDDGDDDNYNDDKRDADDGIDDADNIGVWWKRI